MRTTVSDDFRRQLAGFGLTTAKITYRFPDAPTIINPQFFVWQEYDIYPTFPELSAFLKFWQRKLDGPLAFVEVAHSKLIKPAEFTAIGGEFRLQ